MFGKINKKSSGGGLAEAVNVDTAVSSTSGWTATGSGLLNIGGRSSAAGGYYYLKDETTGVYVGYVYIADESKYASTCLPVIKGHAYKKYVSSMRSDAYISDFYELE